MAGVLDALLGQEAGLAKLVQSQEANKIAREQLEINRAMAIAQGGGAAMLGLTGGAAIGQGIGNLFGLNPSAELQNVRNNPMQAMADHMQRIGVNYGEKGSAEAMRDFFLQNGLPEYAEAAMEAGLKLEQQQETLTSTRRTRSRAENTETVQFQKEASRLAEPFVVAQTATEGGLEFLKDPNNPMNQGAAIFALARAIQPTGPLTENDVAGVLNRGGQDLAAGLWNKWFANRGAPLQPHEVEFIKQTLLANYRVKARAQDRLLKDLEQSAKELSINFSPTANARFYPLPSLMKRAERTGGGAAPSGQASTAPEFATGAGPFQGMRPPQDLFNPSSYSLEIDWDMWNRITAPFRGGAPSEGGILTNPGGG